MNAHATTATPQRLSALLSQVAVIVSVKTSSLGLMRVDKQASVESDQAHGARRGTGRTLASRLSGAEDRVKNINSAQTEVVDTVKRWSTAWDKRRMIPNVNIQSMLGEISVPKANYETLVKEFIADAPRLIALAEQNKGTYDVETPTLEECQSAFSLTLEMEQIPDSATFSAPGLDKQVEEELKRRMTIEIAGAR